MTPKLLRVRVVGALAIALAICSGCTFAAASALPSAVSAAPFVVENQGRGRANSYWAARFDDVVAAVLRAGERLELEIAELEMEDDRATLRYVDDQDKSIDLRIDRRTDAVTRVQFDAGSREFLGFAGLLGRQIADELNDADAFLVDWSDGRDTRFE